MINIEQRTARLGAVARGSIVNLVGGASNAALTFALILTVTRSLGANGSGVLFQALAVLAILTVIVQLGATSAVVRPIAQLHGLNSVSDLQRTLMVACGPVMILGLCCGAVLGVAASDIAPLLVATGNRSAMATYLQWFAFALPFVGVLGVLVSALRGLGSMSSAVAVESISVPGMRLLLALIVFSVTTNPILVGSIWPLTAIAGFVVASLLLMKLLGALRDSAARQSSDTLRSTARSFWRFAAPQSASSMLQIGVHWLDVLLLGVLASAAAAGIYSAVSRMAIVGTLPLVAVSLAAAPQVSRLIAQRHLTELSVVYRTSTAWLVTLSAPIYILMGFFAPLLLKLFGPEFVAGATPLRILAVANLVEIAAGPVLMLLLMAGRSGLLLLNSVIGLLINVVLNVALIPMYGATGAALAWGATIVAINVLGLAQVWTMWAIHPFGAAMRRALLTAFALYGGVSATAYAILGDGLDAFLASAALSTLVYAAVILRRSDAFGFAPVRASLRAAAEHPPRNRHA